MNDAAVEGAGAPPTIAVAPTPADDWDAFVASYPDASIYLRSAWSLLARDVFGHRTFFLTARSGHRLVGVLPLVQQRGLLGNFVTSIPFFNYGGALTAQPAVAIALMQRARELAREIGSSYLELRDVEERARDWTVRTDKASMILQLPGSAEALGKQLGSKLRSQIKRAERENLEVRAGGGELLDRFYDVFSRNMRDLGTPVYPRRFFRAILEKFPAETGLLVIERSGIPAAAGFLVFDGARAEIPWACCRDDMKPLGVNMKLYWEVLSFVIARQCTSFDFGRSTIDSGTYRFKKQWGAVPLPLHWHRWERKPDGGSEGRVKRIATSAWRRLPLPIANVLGPLISPSLPW